MDSYIGILIFSFIGSCFSVNDYEAYPDHHSSAKHIELASRAYLITNSRDIHHRNSTGGYQQRNSTHNQHGKSSICTKAFSCLDCHTSRVCRPTNNGNFEVVETVKCSGDHKFCDPDTGSCVTEQPDVCGEKSNSVCLANGKFPDKQCNRFRSCVNSKSFNFQCAVKGENYNPLSQTCEAGVPCGSFNCLWNKGRKVPHTYYPKYYAYCGSDSTPFVVDSCPGSYELNTTSQRCEPRCHGEGLLQDLEDCHCYYKCTKVVVSRRLHYTLKERKRCPDGQGYSSSEFMCVDASRLSQCSRNVI